jgi:hypothetical protein
MMEEGEGGGRGKEVGSTDQMITMTLTESREDIRQGETVDNK